VQGPFERLGGPSNAARTARALAADRRAAARAADMPLRLDNANALPTYPQQKQQDAV